MKNAIVLVDISVVNSAVVEEMPSDFIMRMCTPLFQNGSGNSKVCIEEHWCLKVNVIIIARRALSLL